MITHSCATIYFFNLCSKTASISFPRGQVSRFCETYSTFLLKIEKGEKDQGREETEGQTHLRRLLASFDLFYLHAFALNAEIQTHSDHKRI
ncbi:hypothetical protein H5410_027084 [Solanum commersonii]|uniref:Uncharacterized protein n=1 Tax=Solanum commersonii TaxID=4109 RepID=A0A9J5Z0S2_SOLCO|nr:hypothetical protein H5410_027084 [Solanum commersonii]